MFAWRIICITDGAVAAIALGFSVAVVVKESTASCDALVGLLASSVVEFFVVFAAFAAPCANFSRNFPLASALDVLSETILFFFSYKNYNHTWLI